MTDDRNPEALLRCGAPHGDGACEQPLVVKLSRTDTAIYMCNRGHRLGDVSDVDAYVLAVVLGALSKPKVRQQRLSAVPVKDPRAFADWWDTASPSARHDLMSTAIDHISVAPSSAHELDTEPVVVVHWREDLPSKVEGR
jgi:hypothetical protein